MTQRVDAAPSRDAIARAVGRHYAPLIAKAGYPELARAAQSATYSNIGQIGMELSALAYRDGTTTQLAAAINALTGIKRASLQQLQELAQVHGVRTDDGVYSHRRRWSR